MFLSTLLIDTGTNPDRERPGRKWLRNLYRVHQRLCMAFPSKERKCNDADMIKPFSPDDFGQGQIHVQRNTNAGFLFRVDPQPGGSVAIVVLSALERIGITPSTTRDICWRARRTQANLPPLSSQVSVCDFV